MAYRVRKPEFIPTLFMLVVTAIMFKLGFWQLDRLAWKNAIQAEVDQAQSQPPRDITSYTTDELKQKEWHNVIMKGRFHYDKELYATPRYLKEQMGYGILTPLEIETPHGTQYVLINRGWVPAQKKDPAARIQGNPDAQVQVEGIIRSHLDRGWIWRTFFTNLPDKNVWVWYDMPAMEKQTGLTMLPVMIDASRVTLADGTAVSGGPTPFPLEIVIRNDHLGYAITWFLIGISGIIIFVVYYTEKKEDTAAA